MNEIELEKILKALGNRRRLAILKILKRRKDASVGNLAEGIKLSFRSVSKHLSILYAVGILEKEQFSLEVFYCIAPQQSKVSAFILSII